VDLAKVMRDEDNELYSNRYRKIERPPGNGDSFPARVDLSFSW